MRTKIVDQIIQRLKKLRFEESSVLRQLEEAMRIEAGQVDYPHIEVIAVGEAAQTRETCISLPTTGPRLGVY